MMQHHIWYIGIVTIFASTSKNAPVCEKLLSGLVWNLMSVIERGLARKHNEWGWRSGSTANQSGSSNKAYPVSFFRRWCSMFSDLEGLRKERRQDQVRGGLAQHVFQHETFQVKQKRRWLRLTKGRDYQFTDSISPVHTSLVGTLTWTRRWSSLSSRQKASSVKPPWMCKRWCELKRQTEWSGAKTAGCPCCLQSNHKDLPALHKLESAGRRLHGCAENPPTPVCDAGSHQQSISWITDCTAACSHHRKYRIGDAAWQTTWEAFH